jgi:hypothetical protein
MKFDRKIRFAALVDGNGGILDGGMREGVEPIEPLEKTPELIAKLVSVQKAGDLAEFLGKPEYSILVHENVTAIIFKSKKKFVLVTVDRKFMLNRVSGLSKLVMAWEQK